MLTRGEFKKFGDLPIGGKFLLDGNITLTLAFVKTGEAEAEAVGHGIGATVMPEQVVQEVVEVHNE